MCLPELWKVAIKLDIALVSNLKITINGNNFQLKIKIKEEKRTTVSKINAEVNTGHLHGQTFKHPWPSHLYVDR